jgi:hypothetical protein
MRNRPIDINTQTMKKQKIIKQAAAAAPKLNDGTNTPVPAKARTKPLSAGEAALFKQAENPLGDPHKT